jgi:hypothetical protein
MALRRLGRDVGFKEGSAGDGAKRGERCEAVKSVALSPSFP